MEKFFSWTAWPMTPPPSYGAFHLCFWIIGIAACILIGYLLRKKSEKKIKLALFIIGIFLLLTEIYKQLFYVYVIGDGAYQWWIFPFQLCSVPMYLCIIQFFIKNEKVNNAIYNFLLAFAFFTGFVSFIEPSGLVHSYWTLTLHAFIWHMSLVLIGLILFCSKKAGNKFKDFLPAMIIYGICVVIAEIIDLASQGIGGLNMFYISPYVQNPIIIFKDIYLKVGWFWCSLIYTICIMIGAFLIFTIFVLIRKLINKKTKNKIIENNDNNITNNKNSEKIIKKSKKIAKNNKIKEFFYRIGQFFMKIALCFLPWREPKLLKGKGASEQVGSLLKKQNIKSVLIVTDEGIKKFGLCDSLINGLEKNKVNYVIYDKTTPNPTISNIEEALNLYTINSCSAIVAVGGGSPMDCAKGVGARVACPNKKISKMRGQLKVTSKLPLLVAIPTTAGTGSETTLAAVITDEKTHEKYAINDPDLIPRYAVIDPYLTKSLPPFLTATTGMDALTHAVEAYIGHSNTKSTKQNAEKAIKLIFENLENAFKHGDDIKSRENMQLASYLAGLSFTRAFVGNVHAIAHTLGGEYHVPHGLANAVILPVVLREYGDTIVKSISSLSKKLSLFPKALTDKEMTDAFIEKIEMLNEVFEIPKTIKELKEKDISILAERANQEANPLYPVPKIFDLDDFEKVYRELLQKK